MINDYIMFGRPAYSESEFDLTISRGGNYCTFPFSRDQALSLMQDIHYMLGLPQVVVEMTRADLGLPEEEEILL